MKEIELSCYWSDVFVVILVSYYFLIVCFLDYVFRFRIQTNQISNINKLIIFPQYYFTQSSVLVAYNYKN